MSWLGPDVQPRASALEFGPPWWNEYKDVPNRLIFDNDGGDPVATCQLDVEVASLFSGITRSLWTRLINRPMPFSRAVHNPAHDYGWPVVGSTIVPFLRSWLDLERR
jgi:hypothetical protein